MPTPPTLYDPAQLPIEIDDVLRAQGANPLTIRARRPVVLNVAQQAIDTGLPLLHPMAWQQTIAVRNFQHETLTLESGEKFKSPLMARYLSSAQKLTVVICTIGRELEIQVESLIKSDPPLGFALDAYGSAAEGLPASVPLSPGDSGWPVDISQPLLFGLLDPDPEFVHLTDGFQMVPRKSTSFIVGWGCASDGTTPCDFCATRATCPKWKFQTA
jgi:hypothetical protein